MNHYKGGIFRFTVMSFIIVVSASLSGCTRADESYKNNPEVYSKERRECIEPENPYDEGSGHYAGFAWGEEGKDCGGNSSSFIEGCEMAQELYAAFTECENAQ